MINLYPTEFFPRVTTDYTLLCPDVVLHIFSYHITTIEKHIHMKEYWGKFPQYNKHEKHVLFKHVHIKIPYIEVHSAGVAHR